MNTHTLESFIAQICDADKRNTDPKTKRAAECVIVHHVNAWYAMITQE